MSLIKVQDSKYEEYEKLLFERDQIRKEAENIWIRYIKEFGQLITDVYEKKIECIKLKKTIAYCQRAKNSGTTVDIREMRKHLEKEMSGYYVKMKQMVSDNEMCKKVGIATAYEAKRAKELYHRIAKLIHPDIYPETDRSEKLREMWDRTVLAYNGNDVKELSELEVMIKLIVKDAGKEDIVIDIPDIEERKAEIKKEIDEIKSTDPYIYIYLLENEHEKLEFKSSLERELEEYEKYRNELEKVLNDLLNDGGTVLEWEMR